MLLKVFHLKHTTNNSLFLKKKRMWQASQECSRHAYSSCLYVWVIGDFSSLTTTRCTLHKTIDPQTATATTTVETKVRAHLAWLLAWSAVRDSVVTVATDELCAVRIHTLTGRQWLHMYLCQIYFCFTEFIISQLITGINQSERWRWRAKYSYLEAIN